MGHPLVDLKTSDMSILSDQCLGKGQQDAK